MTYLPFMQHVLQTQPVPLADGIIVVGAGLIVFLIIEAEKRLRQRLAKHGRQRIYPSHDLQQGEHD